MRYCNLGILSGLILQMVCREHLHTLEYRTDYGLLCKRTELLERTCAIFTAINEKGEDG